jgi:hypothetical protein
LNSVHVRWLKLAWALVAILPLAAILTPVLAPRIGVIFIACAIYLLPASWLTSQLGFEPFTPAFAVIAAAYCAVIGVVVATLGTWALRLPAALTRRRAVGLAAIVWIPAALFVSYRVLQYGGVFAREIPCPGHLDILQSHCHAVSDLLEQELDGFIDTSYVASFRMEPAALQTIVTANAMMAVDPQKVPESHWRQPPIWWTPDRSPETRVYTTPGFTFTGRSGDGDHYLLFDDRAAGKVYVYLESNF